MVSRDFSKSTTISNNITGIPYGELPHGFQVDITFGIHKRNFTKRFVIMPE